MLVKFFFIFQLFFIFIRVDISYRGNAFEGFTKTMRCHERRRSEFRFLEEVGSGRTRRVDFMAVNEEVWVVIPARYQARRFPGKSLALLRGKAMVLWVLEACRAARLPDQVVVATDDRRIAETVEAAGGRVVMTASSHPSGTARLAEVAHRHPEVKWFINVQGDEPGIEPGLVDRVIRRLQERSDPGLVVSAAAELQQKIDYHSPHVVKVVFDFVGKALYFSRSAIPFYQDLEVACRGFQGGCPGVYQHLGVYGYSGEFLRNLQHLRPGVLAGAENLEQLNWLENGVPIEILTCASAWGGIDTPEELERLAAKWSENNRGFVGERYE